MSGPSTKHVVASLEQLGVPRHAIAHIAAHLPSYVVGPSSATSIRSEDGATVERDLGILASVTTSGCLHSTTTPSAVAERASAQTLPFVIFSLFVAMHDLLLVLHKSLVLLRPGSNTVSRPHIILLQSLFYAEYKFVRDVVLPTLAQHALNHLLGQHLDQTFGLRSVAATVRGICDREYTPQMDVDGRDASDETVEALRTAPTSNVALLLLQAIHASVAFSNSCARPARSAEGRQPPPSQCGRLPPWIAATWACHRQSIVVDQSFSNNVGEGLMLAVDRRGAPQPERHGEGPTMQSVAALPHKRTRSGAKRRIDFNAFPPSSGEAHAAGSTARASSSLLTKKKRSTGLRPLPIDLQCLCLEYLQPRHLICAVTTCYLWRSLGESTCTLYRPIAASRAMRDAYRTFCVDDWGEKYLALRCWSSLQQQEGLMAGPVPMDNTADSLELLTKIAADRTAKMWRGSLICSWLARATNALRSIPHGPTSASDVSGLTLLLSEVPPREWATLGLATLFDATTSLATEGLSPSHAAAVAQRIRPSYASLIDGVPNLFLHVSRAQDAYDNLNINRSLDA